MFHDDDFVDIRLCKSGKLVSIADGQVDMFFPHVEIYEFERCEHDDIVEIRLIQPDNIISLSDGKLDMYHSFGEVYKFEENLEESDDDCLWEDAESSSEVSV